MYLIIRLTIMGWPECRSGSDLFLSLIFGRLIKHHLIVDGSMATYVPPSIAFIMYSMHAAQPLNSIHCKLLVREPTFARLLGVVCFRAQVHNETSSKRVAGASLVMLTTAGWTPACKWSLGGPAPSPQPAFSPLCIKNSGFLHMQSMLSHHNAHEIRQSPSSKHSAKSR